jgi:sugar lactone lactonase YvrE
MLNFAFLSRMAKTKQIGRIDPPAGIPGGEVAIEVSGATSKGGDPLEVWFGDKPAHIVAATGRRALVLVPELDNDDEIEVSVDEVGESAKPSRFITGRKLAGDIHPVANPAFDPTDGSLFVTKSGARGEHVPVSLYRITSDGDIEEFSGDIINPTSIAFDRTGRMFVTSRLDGTVYRVTPLKEVVVFAGELGIATGLAFNRQGEMFVGDRGGRIYRVNEIGAAEPWAELEPSVSAYHLACGPDDALYVTGPTVSSFDSITRFDEDGKGSVFYRGLGRPQGLAFDRDGNLYVAASLRGRRGIVRISPDGANADIVVAGMNLVGLAFSANGELVVATNEAVYSLPLGIYGLLLD